MLLPLVLAAMAKPSRVETGAMPKASLGIRARAKPSRPVLAVAGVALLPLVLAAMAKPSRVETGAMPKASLGIRARAKPSCPAHADCCDRAPTAGVGAKA